MDRRPLDPPACSSQKWAVFHPVPSSVYWTLVQYTEGEHGPRIDRRATAGARFVRAIGLGVENMPV